MGFFADFNAWLVALLATYISDNVVRVAAVLEPFLVTLGTLYVMVWGFLQLTGQIQQPLMDGLKRIAVVGLLLGIAIHLWLYQTVIVDTVFNAPAQLGAALIGGYDPIAIVDEILIQGSDAASLLIEKGGIFDGDFSFYLAGFLVYAVIVVTAVYAMFLLSLSRIALSVLLTLGPLFIGLLFFATTRRFFEAWCAQLANYALITILTVLMAALMLSVVTTAARQAVATGGGIQITDGVRLCIAAGLTFLVFRQVMPIAAGLASGIALSTFGAMSALMAYTLGSSKRATGDFLRGATMDRQTSRWDSLSRRAGYYLGAGTRRLAPSSRSNAIRR
jgi:type IV secretion system protein VirB6